MKPDQFAVSLMAASNYDSFLFVDDFYFSALHDEEFLIPISDVKFAEELQLQEAIASSIFTSITMAISTTKSEKGESSRSETTTVCVICTDTKSLTEMFTSRVCSHSFCSDCISKHIAAKLQDGIAVKCPEPNCAAALDPEMCGSFVPKVVLERWGDALFEATILKMKRLHCPFQDCAAAMLDDDEEAVTTSVECPNCRRLFCAQCEVGWHAEMECGEFQKLRGNREDVMAMKLADRKKWKRCPNCKIYVEKIDGCLHITCRCGSEFCYSCGSTWSDIHECVHQ